MNRRWQKFVQINNLITFNAQLEDLVEANLILIDKKIDEAGLKLPLGNGLELLLAKSNSQQLTNPPTPPTSVFTTNGLKKLALPADLSRYYILEEKTFRIHVLLSTEIMLG